VLAGRPSSHKESAFSLDHAVRNVLSSWIERPRYEQLYDHACAMKLSSLDIRKQQFSRIVRGYDRDEVDAFLDMVGTQWQELIDDLRRAQEKLSEMKVQLEHYQKVEEALEEAIKGARQSAERKIETAEKAASAILEKAEARAVKITLGAEEERLKIKRETAKYSLRQKEMLAKFRSFLTSELEMLTYHEKHDSLRMSDHEAAKLGMSSVVEDEEFERGINLEEDSDPTELAVLENYDEIDQPAEETEAVVESAFPEMEDAAGSEVGSDVQSSDSIDGDRSGSTRSSKHRKPTWTVNTLVSPNGEDEAESVQDEPASDASSFEPSDDMKAAQDEIENLRKLLKDLE
jgi:DivIVA domain-containing protein